MTDGTNIEQIRINFPVQNVTRCPLPGKAKMHLTGRSRKTALKSRLASMLGNVGKACALYPHFLCITL